MAATSQPPNKMRSVDGGLRAASGARPKPSYALCHAKCIDSPSRDPDLKTATLPRKAAWPRPWPGGCRPRPAFAALGSRAACAAYRRPEGAKKPRQAGPNEDPRYKAGDRVFSHEAIL